VKTYWKCCPGGPVRVAPAALSYAPVCRNQEVLKIRKADYGSSNLSVACEIRGRGKVYPGLDARYSSHSGPSHRCWWELAHAQPPGSIGVHGAGMLEQYRGLAGVCCGK